jgi:L-ascorbate metabolism protein UlaG (beta-lactamase superfamily)
MNRTRTIRYYGWSGLSLETPDGALFFDPFFRRYCGVQWFRLEDFGGANYICVTHGHEEHFLDVPVIARRTGATVIGPKAVCDFLRWRSRLPTDKLVPIRPFETRALPGFKVSAFHWKHRDINLVKALSKAVFQGNTTQLAWAWSSATRAPFYAPYTGYHVELPDGLTVLNYNEGFNTKMSDEEVSALGQRFRIDVLLAGMQLHFVADVARGAAALNPKVVILYPPHEKLHAMMGASTAPWEEFREAVKRRLPDAAVVVARPGTVVDVGCGTVLDGGEGLGSARHAQRNPTGLPR